ncbi:Uncharacterised protein [Serratia fonticola]|uniref:Uncharacterized protein n=1 Tax=Serratia fonticola TaxID=47917 RepID=A0A4U9WC28_SERFO|nr:Uncharacterised protein [Serratia fonticola]
MLARRVLTQIQSASLGMCQLPTVGIFAFGVVRSGVPNGVPWRSTAGHGAGVGAVQGKGFTFGGDHIGQKTFVALDERGGFSGGSKIMIYPVGRVATALIRGSGYGPVQTTIGRREKWLALNGQPGVPGGIATGWVAARNNVIWG